MRYLVCDYLDGEDDRWSSSIRECRAADLSRESGTPCGATLWVSDQVVDLIDAEVLIPICWTCHVKLGGTFIRLDLDEARQLADT